MEFEQKDFDDTHRALVKQGPFIEGPFSRAVSVQAAAMVGEHERTLPEVLLILSADLASAALAVAKANS